MQKVVSMIPEKKRREITAALQNCNSREEAARVAAKYASCIPKNKVKDIFDKLEKSPKIDYDQITKIADEIHQGK